MRRHYSMGFLSLSDDQRPTRSIITMEAQSQNFNEIMNKFNHAKESGNLLSYKTVQSSLDTIFDRIQHVVCPTASVSIDNSKIMFINEYFVMDKLNLVAPCYIIDKIQFDNLLSTTTNVDSVLGFCYSTTGKGNWTIIAQEDETDELLNWSDVTYQNHCNSDADNEEYDCM